MLSPARRWGMQGYCQHQLAIFFAPQSAFALKLITKTGNYEAHSS